jgi:pimeloyl-ACP methyl ester carboxylesterase
MSSAEDAVDNTRPTWFSNALVQRGEVHDIDVEGARVSYQAWGPSSPTGIVLVHGGAAHSHWWDHLAPMLATNRQVVALDLTGHGDSGRRERYALATWAAEVMAVARDAFNGPPTVIGHSMGGMVTLAAAARYGQQLAGALLVDTPVQTVTPEEMAARDHIAFGPPKVYPTQDAIRAKFRVVPDQATLPYIFDHIAETSIRAVEGGWSWKFDPAIFAHTPLSPDELTRFDCRIAVFRPESGLVDEDMGAMIIDRLGRVAPLVEIPEAAHHVMLDQPLALITGLRAVLADWAHSTLAEPLSS